MSQCPVCGSLDGTCVSGSYRLAHPVIPDEPEAGQSKAAPLRLPRQHQKGAGYVGNVEVYDPSVPTEVRIVGALPPRPHAFHGHRGDLRSDR